MLFQGLVALCCDTGHVPVTLLPFGCDTLRDQL